VAGCVSTRTALFHFCFSCTFAGIAVYHFTNVVFVSELACAIAVFALFVKSVVVWWF
jgi:hypothetical protein